MLLGQIDEPIFTNVFAIGMRELQELSTLDDTKAADELYKLSSGLDRVSLVDVLRSLRVPRHMFKFMYRLLVAHCNAHTDDKPLWQVPQDTFEATLAVYRRDQEAVDRGLQAG